MADPLSIAATGLDLAQALAALRPESPVPNKRRQEICLWLRSIYFMPDGVISILEDIADGRPIDERRRESVLSSFNDAEWRIREISDQLDFETLRRDVSISLRTARQLDLVRWGKLSLRREIQDAINHYGQPHAKLDRTKIRRLLGAVKELNAQIEEVEATLNG